MPGSELSLVRGTVRKVMDNVLIEETAVVYSDPFMVENNDVFSIFAKIESSTTPHVKITRCYNFSLADPPDSGSWAEVGLDGSTEEVVIADFTSEDQTFASEDPAYAVWMRYKVTGLALNTDDTYITIVVAKQAKGHRLE